jgi:hypothetical protein
VQRRSIGAHSGREDHELNVSESLVVYAWALARNRGARADVEAAIMDSIAIGPGGKTRAERNSFLCRSMQIRKDMAKTASF